MVEKEEPVLRRTALQAETSWGLYIPRALPPVTQGSALQAPERMWGPIRGRTETSTGQGFILVYRLAMDARTWRGDGVAGRKYPSLLEDFQTGTASMARKRHLHLPQGVFNVFVLWHRYGFKRFKGFNFVLSVLEKRKGNYWTGMSGRRD